MLFFSSTPWTSHCVCPTEITTFSDRMNEFKEMDCEVFRGALGGYLVHTYGIHKEK